MQDKKYSVELSKLIRHKNYHSKHILKKEDYRDFKGFSEWEIWGDCDDLTEYENWLKEL